MSDQERTCLGCGVTKPLEEYDIDKNARLGRRSRCKPCRSAQMKAWYAANQERQRDRQRERFETNREAIQQQDRERYERNRDARIEVAMLAYGRRRARLANVTYDPTVTHANLRKQYGDRCFYCDVDLDFKRYRRGERPDNLGTLEHMVPISLGGGHTWTNCVLACWRCNISKNAMPLEKWLAKAA